MIHGVGGFGLASMDGWMGWFEWMDGWIDGWIGHVCYLLCFLGVEESDEGFGNPEVPVAGGFTMKLGRLRHGLGSRSSVLPLNREGIPESGIS